MPLQSKQLPPYYTPLTTFGTETYTTLINKIQPTANVDATLTTLQTATIPANTLTEQAQRLEMTFVFQLAGGAAPKTIKLTNDGTLYTFTDLITNGVAIIKGELSRRDTDTMIGFYQLQKTDGPNEYSFIALGSYDFTQPFTILIQAQGTASNQITLQTSYINIIKPA